MKIEFTKDWCLRMAELEAQCTSDFTVGTELPAERSDASLESDTSNIGPNIVFGRFVRLMRRKNHLTLEKLAEDASIEVTELFEIEEDTRHVPDARTVYQLAQRFQIGTPQMMQLAGLSRPKSHRFTEEAIRFAARSESVEELTAEEQAALDAFVSVLSERSENR